jgi:hypothetical protein
MKTYSSQMIESQFLQFESPRGFRRIDANHTADWYLGLDENGHNAIRLVGYFSPQKIIDTSAIQIQHFSNENKITFQLSLINGDFRDIFINLCSDLINLTVSKNTIEAYDMSLIRIESWKSMFQSAPKQIMSYSEMLGLIGELLFLKNYCFKNFTIEESLRSWSGFEKTKKDFSINNEWHEIKTTSSTNGTVKISSLEQLESVDQDNGYLVILHLERMSGAYGGITLNELINEIGNEIGNNEGFRIFQSKLDLTGYQFHEKYDDYRFSIISFKKYIVNNEFPKLTKSQLPFGIVAASYDIDVNVISDFFSGEIK